MKEEVRIGEKMSNLVDMTTAFEHNNDVYESEIMALTNQPLDQGRLIYYKLRKALKPSTPVEVIWNHFNNRLTIIVGSEEHGYEVTLPLWKGARVEVLHAMNNMVADVKAAEPWLT